MDSIVHEIWNEKPILKLFDMKNFVYTYKQFKHIVHQFQNLQCIFNINTITTTSLFNMNNCNGYKKNQQQQKANGLASTGKYEAGSIPSFAGDKSLFVKAHAY